MKRFSVFGCKVRCAHHFTSWKHRRRNGGIHNQTTFVFVTRVAVAYPLSTQRSWSRVHSLGHEGRVRLQP